MTQKIERKHILERHEWRLEFEEMNIRSIAHEEILKVMSEFADSFHAKLEEVSERISELEAMAERISELEAMAERISELEALSERIAELEASRGFWHGFKIKLSDQRAIPITKEAVKDKVETAIAVIVKRFKRKEEGMRDENEE
jgi:tetrahydromethanopterin S-methyltransferase subunit B